MWLSTVPQNVTWLFCKFVIYTNIFEKPQLQAPCKSYFSWYFLAEAFYLFIYLF